MPSVALEWWELCWDLSTLLFCLNTFSIFKSVFQKKKCISDFTYEKCISDFTYKKEEKELFNINSIVYPTIVIQKFSQSSLFHYHAVI